MLREVVRVALLAQGGETMAVPRQDGSVCVVTRERVSAAVNTLRPRVRHVIHLLNDDCWRREEVADQLRFSLETVERDQAEGRM